MAHTVVAVYDDYNEAQQALNELTRSGFSLQQINLSPNEDTGDARAAALRSQQHDESTGVTGTISGFFRSLFGSDQHDENRHADIYSEAVRRGSYLLTVHTDSDDESDRATEIINRYQPVDVDERSAHWQSQGWSKYDASAPVLSDTEIQQERTRYTSATMPQSADSTMQGGSQARMQAGGESRTQTGSEAKTAIPVIQEELQVGKREVERGGVRVFQRVVDTPVQEQVNLREERVTVDRHAVNEPASAADLAALKDASFEMRETAEEAVVAKSARVVEEVVINKEVGERTETISDTLRRTDVEVEKMGGSPQSASSTSTSAAALDDSDFRSHWQSAYGSSGEAYEDYAPAYKYGYQTAGGERYRNHRWGDVEPQVRQEWEAGNAGHPWERVKDAVRYGWEKVTK